MNLIPYSRYARTVFNYEKSPFLHEFLDESDTPLDIRGHPPGKKYVSKGVFINTLVGGLGKMEGAKKVLSCRKGGGTKKFSVVNGGGGQKSLVKLKV